MDDNEEDEENESHGHSDSEDAPLVTVLESLEHEEQQTSIIRKNSTKEAFESLTYAAVSLHLDSILTMYVLLFSLTRFIE